MPARLTAATPVGVFTLADAHALGWTTAAVRHRVEAGLWRRVHRGVFVAGRVSLTPLGSAVATALATGGVPSHTTAARLHGLWVVDNGDWATIAEDARRRRRPGLRLTRGALPAADTCELAGVTVTTPRRTVADLCRDASRWQAVCAVESGVRHRLLHAGDLQALRAHELPRVRKAVELADFRSESPLETGTRLHLHAAGLYLEPQVSGHDH